MLSNIKKLYIIFCIALLVFFSLPLAVKADAGVPTTLSYQGLLTDSGGNVLGAGGTSYYFKFSLWDSPTVGSGTKLWPSATPTATTLTVKQGVFTVNIGDTTNGYPDALNYNFNTNSKIYLQVEVSGNNVNFETLTPRSQIAANAFSQVSNQVNGTGASSFGTTTPFANTLISAISTAISQVTMSIKAIAGQVADLFNVSDSTGNTIFNVTAGGNVGVGTTSPAAKLDVWGNFRVGTSSTPNLFVNTSSNFVGIGTNLQATSTAKLSLAGGVSWITGLGAISHIIGPTDQDFTISSGKYGGNLNLYGIDSNPSNNVVGASVNIKGGSTNSLGGPRLGGNVNITGGTAFGNSGDVTASPGSVNITGGAETYNGIAGAIVISSGATGGSGRSGSVTIQTPIATDEWHENNNTVPGAINILGGTAVNSLAGSPSSMPGGAIIITSGTGRGGTTGSGKGGVINLTTGSGGVVTGSGTANNGGNFTLLSGAGGSVTGGSGTRTGGNSGNIAFLIGAPGAGATAPGVAGNMYLTETYGNVGVGIASTTAPWAKLAIMQAFGGTSALFDVASTTSAGNATSSLFNIAANGSVGIGTNLQATSTAKLSLAGGISWITGLGAVTHLMGPTDQPFAIAASAPVQQSAGMTGNNLNLYASNGTGGSSGYGPASGGNLNLTAGNANAGLGGNSADGGSVNITAGNSTVNGTPGNVIIKGGGGNSTGNITLQTITASAGTVGSINFLTGSGSNYSGVGTVNGGNAGSILLTLGAGGDTGPDNIGIGGIGGQFAIVGGAGGNVTRGGTTLLGGIGSTLTFTSGKGGSVTGGSGTRTGGNSGNIAFLIGAPGAGATAPGVAGNMYLTETYGNVGVGIASTTAPWAKLAIMQAFGGTSALFDVASTTSAGNATSSLFRILANGNVGIGTTSPNAKLQLAGPSQGATTYGIMSFDTNVGTDDVGIKFGAIAGAGSAGYSFIQSKHTGGSNDGNLVLNPITGNVGIGDASPANPLSVTGIASISKSLAIGAAASVADTDNIFSSIAAGANQGGGTVSAKHASIAFGHAVGNNITASGYGSFAGGYSTSGVITASGNGSFAFGNNVTSISESSISFGTGFSNTIGSSFMVGFGSTTPAFTVNGTKVGVGTTTPSAAFSTVGTVRFASLTGSAANLIVDSLGNVTVSSDERLKDIDSQFSRGLSDLIKINPITFHWKPETGYDTANAYTGFSAQNVQLAIPEAVGINSQTGFLSLADRPILATVVNAIKEINTKLQEILAWFDGGKFHVNNDVCVDDVCITKNQFKELLLRSGAQVQTPTPTSSSTTADGSGNPPTGATLPEATTTTVIIPPADNSTSTDGITTPPSTPVPTSVPDPTITPPAPDGN